jgi:hypothetical protein
MLDIDTGYKALHVGQIHLNLACAPLSEMRYQIRYIFPFYSSNRIFVKRNLSSSLGV